MNRGAAHERAVRKAGAHIPTEDGHPRERTTAPPSIAEESSEVGGGAPAAACLLGGVEWVAPELVATCMEALETLVQVNARR